ncbi:hypothetical protein DCAR_0623506 [Daucus carota subsp. sativus]|uniref:Uncharacterized protein n=1 Tax=Daucus carota subsp. sativus TaxID=79200 RepID=A0A161ZTK1_DAUCS|nr:hypothetical protein DCAR_0623506 [Daucus carota subsp. sativus]
MVNFPSNMCSCHKQSSMPYLFVSRTFKLDETNKLEFEQASIHMNSGPIFGVEEVDLQGFASKINNNVSFPLAFSEGDKKC